MTQSPFSTSNLGGEFSISHWQNRFVLGILRAAAIFGLISIIGTALDPAASNFLRIAYAAVYLILLIIVFAPVPYMWRAGFLLVMGYLLGFNEILGGGLVGAARLYFLGTVILVNLLFTFRASLYALVFTTTTYALAGYALLTGLIQPSLEVSIVGNSTDWISSTTTFIFLTATVNIAIHMLKTEFENAYQRGQSMLTELQANRHKLEERVAERTVSLEKRTAELAAANAVAQEIAINNEIETLLPIVVHAITERFDYYYAGIYLLDDKAEFAYLQAASSEGGKRMLARHHQVLLSTEGDLQKAVSKQTHQVVRDIEAESARLSNPDLPSTRARSVFPLIARDRVIGALDIHSSDPAAFAQSEIETLEILADQLSLAIDNSRLFADMQAIIEQTQQAGDLRSWIAWKELTTRKASVYQYTPLSVQKLASAPERRGDAGALSIPILLRGQSIGKIHLKRKVGVGTWIEQEQAMVRDVATQVGLALENARLLEDAQTRAARERSLGDIAARISAAVDVEAILRTTAQEIGKALGDAEVAVQLHSEGPGQ